MFNGGIFQLVESVFCIYNVIGSSPITSTFMKKQIKKNINQRYSFQQFERKRLVLKSITQNLHLKPVLRWSLQTKFIEFPLKSSPTQIKNKCILTGRSGSIHRLFKMSRLQLRKWASYGFLPGVSKYNK